MRIYLYIRITQERDRSMREGTYMGVDPGPTRSAWVHYDTRGHVLAYGHEANEKVATRVWEFRGEIVIESVDHMGMAVGRDVFETVWWSGYFCAHAGTYTRIPRREVKMALCARANATDANIRQALIDRFGGDEVAIGGKRCRNCAGKGWKGVGRGECASCTGTGLETPRGPLYGLAAHTWSALAVVVTRLERKAPADAIAE